MQKIFKSILVLVLSLPAPLSAEEIEIIDYADDWIKAWKAGKLPSEAPTIYPDYYKFKVKKWQKAGLNPNEELAKIVADFEKVAKKFIRTRESLLKSLRPALATFTETFGKLPKNVSVYVVHSLGELNGGTRKIGDETVFLIGIDMMVKYHHWENNLPFFHHEFFHVLHRQLSGKQFSRGFIGDELWKEGLATYVSKNLNKKSNNAELMLDTPKGLFSTCKSNLDYMSAELLPLLRKENDETYGKYFLFSSKDPKVAPRSGYCVGYFAVEKFAKQFTLQQLVRLPFDKAIMEIEKSLIGYKNTQ